MTQRQTPRQQRPHYTVDMDLDHEARPVTLDARSLTLPSVAVIAVVLSSMGLTYFLAEERTRLDKRIDTVVNSVERLAVSISQLADGLKFGMSDRYTVTHQALWCARAETLNKGFRCPEVSSLTPPSTAGIQNTLESVQGEMGQVVKKNSAAKQSGE